MSNSANLETTSCSDSSALVELLMSQLTLPLTGIHQLGLCTFIRGVHIAKLVLDCLDLLRQIFLPGSLARRGFDENSLTSPRNSSSSHHTRRSARSPSG